MNDRIISPPRAIRSSFVEARVFVRSLKIKSSRAYRDFLKTRNLLLQNENPYLVRDPHIAYHGLGWISWWDWLGKDKEVFEGFIEARSYVRALSLNSVNEWWAFIRKRMQGVNDCPRLPYNPSSAYAKNGWVDWPDWLGNHTHLKNYQHNKRSRSHAFEVAREYVRQFGFKSKSDYLNADFLRRPILLGSSYLFIPVKPGEAYGKSKWISWSDWLGVKIASYEESEFYARSLNFPNKKAWDAHCRMGLLPRGIPHNPHYRFKSNWAGWGYFLRG